MKTIAILLACAGCSAPIGASGPAPHSAYVCTGGDAGDPGGCLAAFVGERDSSCSFSCDNGTCQVYARDGATVGECTAPGSAPRAQAADAGSDAVAEAPVDAITCIQYQGGGTSFGGRYPCGNGLSLYSVTFGGLVCDSQTRPPACTSGEACTVSQPDGGTWTGVCD